MRTFRRKRRELYDGNKDLEKVGKELGLICRSFWILVDHIMPRSRTIVKTRRNAIASVCDPGLGVSGCCIRRSDWSWKCICRCLWFGSTSNLGPSACCRNGPTAMFHHVDQVFGSGTSGRPTRDGRWVMAFDVFKLRDRVVGEYRDYVESFVHIYDPRIERFVHDKLDEGELWPDAVLQLNPAYEPGPTLGELAAKGELHWGTARFFGEDIRLYRHQQEAIRAAARGGPVVTSTGTGSGKSLTYLVPIVDHVLKNQPERHSVRAIIVYPMNALINSQLEALESFSKQNWPECPVRFDHYTGQVRDEARNAIINDPPHILLTNYVMLEYMLIRPAERTLVGLTTRELAFLVDGRAARLSRPPGGGRRDAAAARAPARRAARSGLHRHVGDDRHRRRSDERRARIAEAGRKLFGVEVPPDHVVDETLQRVATVPVPEGARGARGAVRRRAARAGREAVRGHPLAAWVEATFGLAVRGRAAGAPHAAGLREGAEASGRGDRARSRAVPCAAEGRARCWATPRRCRPASRCSRSGCTSSWRRAAASTRRSRSRGARALDRRPGVRARSRRGRAQGALSARVLSRVRPGDYLVSRVRGHEEERLVPRSPLLNAPEDEIPGEALFFTVEHERSGARARTCPTAGTSRAPGSRASRSATGRTCPSTSGCARTGCQPACRWTARSRAGCSPGR